MNTPALVILDMAGTTVEDGGQVPFAFTSALTANGITVSDDDIARVRGSSKREAIRNLLPLDRIAQRLIERLRSTAALSLNGA